MDKIQERMIYIREHLTREQLASQLEEEAIELAMAAAKVARGIREGWSEEVDAGYMEDLIEEYGDVLNILEVMDIRPDEEEREFKMNRWETRLRNRENGDY